MSAFWGHLAGVVTLVLMLTFIGIWIWAWRPRHKPLFDRMAKLPMQEAATPAAVPAAARASRDDEVRRS